MMLRLAPTDPVAVLYPHISYVTTAKATGGVHEDVASAQHTGVSAWIVLHHDCVGCESTLLSSHHCIVCHTC